MLELSAVFLAAATGLRLGWTVIDPGPRPRGQALAEEGRASVAIALGLVVVLLVSGMIEAFVTPSPLPTWARIGIGGAAECLFLAYVIAAGRRAAAAGLTADMPDAPATRAGQRLSPGHRRPVACRRPAAPAGLPSQPPGRLQLR